VGTADIIIIINIIFGISFIVVVIIDSAGYKRQQEVPF
jgi:hypothetical protein